ncbi:nuclear transport factor 2 family protein [Amycolatopsis sp. cmx-11-12]|uniref:nuclear transport factor 2 family protein n=1 Tax=Amycolatopsis sp. cmx-11-12 TaxID=2785795 RepID=UPI003917C83C
MAYTYRLTALALLLSAAACSAEPTAPVPGRSEAPPAAPAPLSGSDRAAAPGITQKFTDAANKGDSPGVAATFAEQARFDSVGRIFPSREAIMSRFIDPEVIGVGGRYEITGARWAGDRYVVDYRFTTRSGGEEIFYYAFLVRDGLIRDVLGRYR